MKIQKFILLKKFKVADEVEDSVEEVDTVVVGMLAVTILVEDVTC